MSAARNDAVTERASSTFNKIGQRLTRHRASVLACLRAAERPLTADEVVQRSKVPLSTAYRNLAELCDVGIAVRVGGADRTDRFEMAESYSSRHHHHLVCTECGVVNDFDPSPALERLIAKEMASLLDTAGFAESHHLFDVHGVCKQCGRR
jgi:Fur family transcriptional regulator, ferric uptake regulator